MIDKLTIEQCKKDKKILNTKIQNLEFAINQSKEIISESSMDERSLTFLRRKISESTQDLETLYLIKHQQKD